MPYATTSDFTSAFGADELLQLTDRDGDGTADPGVFDAAVTKASSMIDGYLAKLYKLPLATVPDYLVKVCLDITRYFLYANVASENVRNGFTDAVKWLINVATGLVTLGLDPVPEAGGNDQQALFTAGKRVITRCTTRDYTDPIDPNRGDSW